MPYQRLRTTLSLKLRRWSRAVGAATIMTGTLVALPAIAQAADGQGADMTSRLEGSQWLSTFEVPGVAVAQIRDGAVTWSKGYGKADSTTGVPVTADTVFRVGSVSKPVTAWGVMRLVEQGRIDLDAPVETYLTRWHLPASRFDSTGVTIRRLLSHTAGLNAQDYSPVTTRPLPSLEQSLTGGSGHPGDRVGSDDVRITAEPGRQFAYSNGGYTLLQLAVEEVVGQPFASYMQREVLDPLGMTHSSFVERPALASVTATGHTRGQRPVPPSLFTEQAAGGLYTSANDVARFVAAGMSGPAGEARGRGVVTPAGVAALFARIPVPDGMKTSLAYELETLPDGTNAAGHGGKNTGWLSQFSTVPDRAEGLVVLTNSDNSGLIGLSTQAWADSLGVGSPMTAQMLAYELRPEFTLMLTLGAVLGMAALGWSFFLVRRHRGGRRTWVSRPAARPHLLGWVLRAAALLTVFTSAAAWWVQPVRATLGSIAPVRTNLVTAALFALCLTAAGAAMTRSTRRAPTSAEQTPDLATAGSGRTA